MPDMVTHRETFEGWTAALVIEAAHAAIDAGDLDGGNVVVEAEWEGRKITERRLDDEIERAILLAGEPKSMSFAATMPDDRAQVLVLGSEGLVSARAEGTDHQTVSRAYDAVVHVLRRDRPGTDKLLSRPQIPAAVVASTEAIDATEATVPARKSRHPMLVWCNENQGLIAVFGLVVTVVGVVLGFALG
jgi:hypothetical protein